MKRKRHTEEQIIAILNMRPPGNVRQTAANMALIRALETAKAADLRLFSDPFALRFLSPWHRTLMLPAVSRARMADVADGRTRPDVWPGASLCKYNRGKAPYAEERYLKEAHRLYSVLDRRLAQHEFVADDYSIADIAIWPWVARYEWQTVDLNTYANVKRWYTVIAGRPPRAAGL